MPVSGLTVHPDCIKAFNDLKLGNNGIKYIIYKISDDQKEIVVDEISKETDYNVFREKLQNAQEKNGKSRPSYAVYDVAFDLAGGEGHRTKITFITYIDQDNTSVKARMTYASSRETLKNSLSGISMTWQASEPGELEWEPLLKEASKGKASA
ncbi:hypothetical protein EPUS_03825 [Endocarpon pusillum Z07020]|uniref:Cofilin n=1 Tax=Endocarpon pusillum (strain Z07020 / HMAS-L-300199) TaxID=1263415 RepID=U1HTR6_ENDPU|nr:uncharacterized protein EPUS_03825 [Endocarpon pusillum Z07020]ERF74010.1 hypothetical protein EPUS_03825 [Endocarpon pusillum Z07020]